MRKPDFQNPRSLNPDMGRQSIFQHEAGVMFLPLLDKDEDAEDVKQIVAGSMRWDTGQKGSGR